MSVRPRGFVDWSPRPHSRRGVDWVSEVLAEYADHLPLTIRQLFYRLVTTRGWEKTELGYKRLIELLNMARRAGLVPMASIRDDGFAERSPSAWRDSRHLVDSVAATVEAFRLDRQAGQPRRLFLWCEAGGMVPQLARVADGFGITVFSSGGFDSLTAKHHIGHTIALSGPTEVLHIGDLDPSGEHVFSSLAEDVAAFTQHYGGAVEFTRLAVTIDQVEAMRLETAPPKPTDRRKYGHNFTAQAEAIPPDALAQIVRDAIEARFDIDALAAVQAAEDAARNGLRPWIDMAPGGGR